MGLFRRKRDDDLDPELEGQDDATDAVEEPAAAAPPRPQGPWDEADAPDDDRQRVDLGGLRVPVLPDTELRVEMSPEGQVVAVTLAKAPSTMQISAFAAPRTEGIWAEVRGEIAEALAASGGNATEHDGPHGPELRALIPTEVAGRGRMLAPTRFLGVDGPRWFLRALLTGPAASEGPAADELLAALKDVVVVRGNDPMAVRDPLPLRLPKEVQEQAQAAQQSAAAQEAARPEAPQVPERGPEITEIR